MKSLTGTGDTSMKRLPRFQVEPETGGPYNDMTRILTRVAQVDWANPSQNGLWRVSRRWPHLLCPNSASPQDASKNVAWGAMTEMQWAVSKGSWKAQVVRSGKTLNGRVHTM